MSRHQFLTLAHVCVCVCVCAEGGQQFVTNVSDKGLAGHKLFIDDEIVDVNGATFGSHADLVSAIQKSLVLNVRVRRTAPAASEEVTLTRKLSGRTKDQSGPPGRRFVDPRAKHISRIVEEEDEGDAPSSAPTTAETAAKPASQATATPATQTTATPAAQATVTPATQAPPTNVSIITKSSAGGSAPSSTAAPVSTAAVAAAPTPSTPGTQATATPVTSSGTPAAASVVPVTSVTLARGPSGFGCRIVGCELAEQAGVGVFIGRVDADPAKSSGLAAGMQLLRLRVDKDWVDLAAATVPQVVALLRGQPSVDIIACPNPEGYRPFDEWAQSRPVEEAAATPAAVVEKPKKRKWSSIFSRGKAPKK